MLIISDIIIKVKKI